jgi:hypothetical protein
MQMKLTALQVIDAKDQRKLARARKLIDRACRLLRDATVLASVGDGTVPVSQPAARRATVKKAARRASKTKGGRSMTPGAIAARKRRAEKKAFAQMGTAPPPPAPSTAATSNEATTTGRHYDPANIAQTPPPDEV